MPKTVFKGFKAISKLPQVGRKKVENQAAKSGEATKKKKSLSVKGLKNLLPTTMGNLTSSLHGRHHNQHHIIENVDEYAANLMTHLEQFRQDGVKCDLFQKNPKNSAHKLVLSFNSVLLDMVTTSQNSVAVDIDSTSEDAKDSALENSSDTGSDVDKDAVAEDGIKDETEAPNCKEEDAENQEIKSDDENGLISQLQTDDIKSENSDQKGAVLTLENDAEENKESGEGNSSEEPTTSQETVEPLTEDPAAEGEDLAPPLSTELAVESNEEQEEKPIGNNPSDDENPVPASLTDPVKILVNFLYTSHIDITQKNVSALRVLATQCQLDDVMTACNEFEKVLHVETEEMPSDEKKDAVAAQFRYRYSDPGLPNKLLQHFAQLRHEDKFTDVIIRSPSKKVCASAHSVLLAAGSNFFQPLLSTNEELRELEVNEIDEVVLGPLMDFMYTGKVNVTTQNVSKLMQASDRMQLNDVIEGCAEFLEFTISVQNCIQHRSIAIDYKCEKLKDFAHDFIVKNFLEVSRTLGFVTLSVGGLLEVTTSNDLQLNLPVADGEMAVFKAVRRWIAHDEENRKQHITEVMSAVRFPLIGERHLLDDVTTDLLIMENQEMCDVITSVISSKPNMRFDQEVKMRGLPCVLTLGGSFPIEDDTSEERGYQAVAYSNLCTLYDVTNGTFQELTLIPETNSLHSVVAVDHFVFVVGGFDSYSCMVSKVHCLDLSDKRWFNMPDMRIKRSCFSLHAVKGYIYAIGGLTPKGYTATVERLDRKKKVWAMGKPLPETRYKHAGCVFKGEILISGGSEKEDRVFSYDPSKDSWKKCHPMNIGRDSHVMETVNDKAYAIGGDGINFSAESYDGTTWTVLVQGGLLGWPKTFYFPGSAVVDDRVFFIGGWKRENEALQRVRYYDTKSGEWHCTSHFLPIPRGSAASCQIFFPTRPHENTGFLQRLTNKR